MLGAQSHPANGMYMPPKLLKLFKAANVQPVRGRMRAATDTGGTEIRFTCQKHPPGQFGNWLLIIPSDYQIGPHLAGCEFGDHDKWLVRISEAGWIEGQEAIRRHRPRQHFGCGS